MSNMTATGCLQPGISEPGADTTVPGATGSGNNGSVCHSGGADPYERYGKGRLQDRLFIGLMSGTSIDGIDAVLMSIGQDDKGSMRYHTLATAAVDWSDEERAMLNGLCSAGSEHDNVYTLGLASNAVALGESRAVTAVLSKAGVSAQDVFALGAHGQTIRHHPEAGFSIQIDNGPLLASTTGIDAVVNFRAADIANGGQGAPLAQAFHQSVFADSNRTRVVLNLGGIANISVLPGGHNLLTAFDTGPANTLMDYVCRTFLDIPFDPDGAHASKGKCDEQQLSSLLKHEYFARPWPKSTGRELFNQDFIAPLLKELNPQSTEQINDLLALLTELTASTVTDAISRVCDANPEVMSTSIDLVACGGGAFNSFLLERMVALGSKAGLELTVMQAQDFGVDPKFLEAEAFAWFAWCTVNAVPLPLFSSSNARRLSIAGTLCPAPDGAFSRLIRATR